MAASKNRIDWGLLLLRLGVGLMAVVHGLQPILGVRVGYLLSHPSALGMGLLLGLLEMICGALVIAGVWTSVAALALAVLVAIPLANASLRGLVGAHLPTLFRVIVSLAAAISGPGKGALAK